MALSPGVYTKEIDLTFNISTITTNASGYVGLFRWGPVEKIVPITTNESELLNKFGRPDADTTSFYHAAANYLVYSVPLYVVRAVGPLARNAINADAATNLVAPQLVKHDDAYIDADLTGISFIGRYAGDLGNSIKVSMANSVGYATWAHASRFTYAPTSANEFNVIVIDEDGAITGTAGTVLETYELMTLTSGAKKTDGTSADFKQVLLQQSNYILVGDTDEIDLDTNGIYEQSLVSGVDDNDVTTAEFEDALDEFKSDQVEIIRFFTSFLPAAAVIYAVDIMDTRGDAIAFLAPRLADVYNNINAVDDVKEYFTTVINKPTSYSFQVDNWKLVNDRYNDRQIWIPCDSDAAGLHARTFLLAEAWFSPAGFNRGQLKNVIRLAWSSNQAQRDVLYPVAVNSIVSFPGEGTVLFGDKTALMAPSAFSRINVRSLFIVIKKSIARAARYQLFELNDYITQSLFRNATDRYLDDIQGRRGIIDKRVVCDSTNNTPQVIDSNEFVGDIYIKPARSINFIRLNFIAVATAIDFEEIEGGSF